MPTPSAPSALWGALLVGGASFAVDPPVVQDANFRVNASYISYLDSQARAAQTHLVQSLIGGLTATWRIVDGGSAAVSAGDVLCLAGSTSGTVTRATTTPLAAAGSVFGIALQGAAPGGSVPIAITGMVPPAITGLPTSGNLTYATVNLTTARLQTAGSIGGSAYVVGTVDAAGNVNVRAMPQLGTGIGIAGDVTGTLGASVVSAISGSSPLMITPAGLRWVAGAISPTISQTIAAAGAGQTLGIIAQAAAAGSASHGGDVQIAGGAPDGAGQQGGVVISSNNAVALLQLHNATSDYLAMGVTPASTGYIRLPNTAAIAWRDSSNVKDFLFYVDASNNLNLGDSSAVLASIHVGCAQVSWNQTISAPTLTQAQQANGGNPNNLTIAPQAPGAGAVTTPTGTPGNLVVNLAAPVSTGTHAYLDVQEGGSSQIKLGSNIGGAAGVPTILASASLVVQSTGGNLLLAGVGVRTLGPLAFQDVGGTPWINVTPSASASLSFVAGVTSAAITQAASAGAANAMSITAQAAGGTNDGGALSLAGGAHAGSSTVDGSVKIGTPLNCGELEFTPVNGAQTLTNAQSNCNVLNLLAGATGVFTVNILRRIADTSLIFVRNNTSQTATIAYLTGGTVTLATATSALIASNGTNLVKIIVGT